MDISLLKGVGLSSSQAKVYLLLTQKGEMSPPKIAEATGESRTNAYMILDKLEFMGLVEKITNGKKIAYQPLNPIALEKLVEERRQEIVQTEERVKHAMPQLLSYFYSFTEKPGIRLLQGREGLKEIYKDTLRTKQDIYFLRTPLEVKAMGADFFERYKNRRASLGITTYAFTQDTPEARQFSSTDKANKMIRTWIDPKAYTAPVEINIYGDKVAFLAYGEDIMGVIIQNPPIAEAMRQIFREMGDSL